MTRSSSSKNRLARIARFLLFGLLALELVYLVGANLFLNTAYGERTVNRRPERWTVSWDGGWTWLPIRLRLDNVEFERHGRGRDVRIEADRVAARVSPWGLLRKRVTIRGARVRGLEVDLQRRPIETPLAETPPAETPPVETPPPQTTAKRPPGWLIAVREVDVDGIESFTLDDFVARGGEARLRGAVDARVRGDVTIRRAALEWREVAVFRGEEVFAEPMVLTFEGDIAPFRPGRDRGLVFLDHLSGRLGVEGAGARLQLLELFLDRAKWIEALDGYGRVRADLVLDRGRLGPGSELEANADGLRLEFLGYATEGSGQIHGTVRESTARARTGQAGTHTEASVAKASEARLEVQFDDFTVRKKPAVESYVEGQGFRLVATTSEPSLRGGMSDLEVVLDMAEATVPDMSVYGSLLPPDLGVSLDSGRGVASLLLQGSVKDQAASGFLRVGAEKVAGHFQDLDFEISLEMDTRISGGNLDDFRVEIEGTRLALVDGVFTDDRNTKETDWWMTVDVASGAVELGGEQPRLEAEVDIGMRDSRPIIALFAELKTWLQRFERILTVKDVWVQSQVSREGRDWALNGLVLKGRKLQGQAELELAEAGRRGILYVKFHGIPIGLELLGTKRDWKLTGVRKWYDRKVAAEWAPGPAPADEPSADEPSADETTAAEPPPDSG